MNTYHYEWATYDNGGVFEIEERSEAIANVHAKLHLEKIVNPSDLTAFALVRISH